MIKQRSLAKRLTTLYALLLGVTVLLVIAACSIALVSELGRFSNDIVIAKHEEARFLASRMQADGTPLRDVAPRIVSAVSGIGMHVAIYDSKGTFLAGDRSVHPPILNQVLSGNVKLVAPRPDSPIEFPVHAKRPPGHLAPPPGPGPRRDWLDIAAIQGGYATFASSDLIIASNLMPYWWIVFGIALAAVLISLVVGMYFAREAIAPVNEVTQSLRALAGGDYTQRRFITARGDEIATLTQAYNDAAASVASAMEERRSTESRMRQFVADAGHELRTPLTVIAGYIDVLRRGAISEPTVAKQILGTMAMEKEHMRGLIDRLMRLARMDSDTPPEPQPIDIAALLRDQADAARR
ncbi:MAG TPA: HAMP domain-containing sensor histidine kinase, partial [Candidatus Baltobacteraceae bacterium]|nr:HAMP domain-containing sensor histidine kinase [Candidatus Baltobacteraceae bacterium]